MKFFSPAESHNSVLVEYSSYALRQILPSELIAAGFRSHTPSDSCKAPHRDLRHQLESHTPQTCPLDLFFFFLIPSSENHIQSSLMSNTWSLWLLPKAQEQRQMQITILQEKREIKNLQSTFSQSCTGIRVYFQLIRSFLWTTRTKYRNFNKLQKNLHLSADSYLWIKINWNMCHLC